MGDDFFAPQHSIGFWQQLEVPKMLQVNQGFHTQAEKSLNDSPRENVWSKIRAWLDHELKGIDNGILTDPVKEPQVRVQAGDSVYSFDYISFPKGWPRTTTNSTPTARNPKLRDNVVGGGPIGSFIVEYALSARGGASGTQYGGLNLISSPRNRNPFTSLHSRKRYNDDPSLNTISYSTYPGIGSTFLLSSSSSGEGYPIPTYLNTVPNTTAILYTTPPLENHVLYSKRNLRPSPRDNKSRVATGEDPISSAEADTKITICGSPEIRNFTFTPFAVWPEDKKRSFSDRWQLYAFLYDQYPTKHKDGYGKGLLISNGAFSHNTGNNYRDWKDNVHIWQRDDGSTAVTIKSFVMRTVCRRIPAGHRLVLGFALAYRGYYLPSFPRNEGSEKSVGSTQPIRSSIPSLNNPPPLLSTSHLEVEVHYDTGSVIRFPFV